MANETNIEWADSTFNPWLGCTKVSPACDHCYAETLMDKRMHAVQWGAGQPRKRTSESNWKNPLRWEKEHKQFYAEHGRRRRVFCASLADVFDNEVPIEWRRDLFDLIEQTPNLDWLLLTKRIGNVFHMAMPGLPKNVWLGATICNQEEADRDIPKLLAINATVRFLSIEPLLGPIDLRKRGILSSNGFGIDWLIVGGESGANARPMHPDWLRSLRDQCESAGVPFLFKQWGEWGPTELEANRHIPLSKNQAIPAEAVAGTKFGKPGSMVLFPVVWVGKHKSGRLLDGVTHTEFPKVGV